MLFRVVAWLYFWPTAALPRCLSLSLSSPSPPSLLCLLYALCKWHADQCPLNLSSASVCAKIIGDSLPAASGANIRRLLLQGVSFVVSTALASVIYVSVISAPVLRLSAFISTSCFYVVYSASSCCGIHLVSAWLVLLPSLSHEIKCLHFQWGALEDVKEI